MKKHTVEIDTYNIVVLDKNYLRIFKRIYGNYYSARASRTATLRYYNLRSIFFNIRDKLEGM